ncbi:MAG: DUF1499 domain-containing protein [Pseudomonadota bacterium]
MSVVLKVLKWGVVLAVLGAVGFAVYVRVAPEDVADWHVDPATITSYSTENAFVLTPDGSVGVASKGYPMTPEVLAERFKEVALSSPRTELLSEEGGFATYVQRSEIMAYPDYISVRAVEAEAGAALYVYSRSRFGRSDFGVNEARVLAWLNRL